MTWRPKQFRLGAMRDRIDIQTPTMTVDAAGQSIPAWTDTIEREPCVFDSASGGETLRGKQVDTSITAVFTIHYRSGLTTQQRVKYNNEYYGIVYVRPVEGGRRYIELQCRGVTSG